MTIDYYGLSNEQFRKRIHFGWKRFVNKLYRVYQRYCYEKENSNLTFDEMRNIERAKHLVLMEARKLYKDIQYDNGPYQW